MSDVVRQADLRVMWLDDRRATLTGPPARVGAAIARLRDQGRLVRSTNPAPTTDGGVLVTITVIPETPPAAAAPPPAASPWTPRIVLGLAAIVGAVFITCGVLALRGLAWLAGHGPLVVGLLVAAGAAVFLCTRAGRAAVSVVVSVIVK